MRVGLSLANAGRVVLWRPLDEGVSTVGANPECDVCVPGPGVAPVQALLRREGDVVTLVNRAASGTAVAGEVVTSEVRLADGDTLSLGEVSATLRFEREREREAPERQTLTLSASEAELTQPWVAFPEAWPGQTFELGERPLTVGSDTGNDVVLADPYVSAFHARVSREGGRVVVRDLGSRNGVFIGERKVREGEAPAGSQVRLGRTLMVVGSRLALAAVGEQAVSLAQPLVGSSPPLAALREKLRRVAASGAPVLITGETGTGKEVAARLIAASSPRADRPFLALNCGALGRSLVESELFGHERGAFTGAVGRKAGAFEAGDGGTLFLDEVGELPLELQPQLLRVLETGEVRRVGSVETFHVDVRLIAATNRRLAQEVSAGRFREDLFHRLHVLVLELPSLRQRREDIVELARHFLVELTPRGENVSLSSEAAAKLVAHDWPGNVRELRNTIQRALLLRGADVLGPDDISFAASTLESRVQTASATRARTLAELEREAIVAELVRFGGNKTEAAAALGLSRSTIHRKIDEYELDVEALVARK